LCSLLALWVAPQLHEQKLVLDEELEALRAARQQLDDDRDE